VRGDYTYTMARDAVTGVQLQRRPKDKYSVQATWQPIDALTLSATALWVGSSVDVDRAFVDPAPINPGYHIINVAADYAVNSRLTVFGRIDNLLNEKYENPNGFLQPGFGVFGGVRVAMDVPGLPK
jgi:vitamin B12 transporter